MIETKEYLAVLAKIMKDERTEDTTERKHYNDLYSIIHTELNAQLKKSQYPNAPALTRNMDLMLDAFEPLVICKEMIGTACLLVSNHSTNMLFHDFYPLFHSKAFVSRLTRMRTQIPFVIINGDNDKIELLNYANKRILISIDEFEFLIAGSNQNRIALNKIVQSFIITTSLQKSDLCLLFDNIYRTGDILFGRAVNKRIACIDAARLKSASKRDFSHFDAISANPRLEEEISKSEELSKLPFIKKQELETYALQQVSPIIYGIIDEYKALEVQVESYYSESIRKVKSTAQDIVGDIVRLGAIEDETLSSIRRDTEARANSLEYEWSIVHLILTRTRECVTTIANDFKDFLCSGKVVPRYVYDFIFDGLFSGARNNDRIGRDALARLTTLDYSDCELVSAYIRYLSGANVQIPYHTIQKHEWEKAKMYIEIADFGSVALPIICHYIGVIEPKHLSTGKEYYAKSLTVEDAKRNAILLKSFERGYEPAGTALLERYKRGDKSINLQSLANAMVPEACMILAEERRTQSLNQKRYSDLSSVSLTYHKIAAAKQYLPSIQIIVDSIFQSRFLRAYQLHNDDFKNPKFQAMIENGHALCQLSSFLIERMYNVNHNSEILGVVLFCLNENLSEAMSCLAGIDTGVSNFCKGNMYEFGKGVSADINQAYSHYKKAVSQGYESNQLQKRIQSCERKLAKKAQHENSSRIYHSSTNYSRSYSNYSSSSSSDSLCFITTATCQALNSTDDCDELMMLRSFRNTHLNGTPEGEAVVREYYRVGPQIVDSINHTENPVALYQNLWERYIEPSCEAIREEKWEKAKGIYIGMVKELCMQFGIGVRPDIRAILKDY